MMDELQAKAMARFMHRKYNGKQKATFIVGGYAESPGVMMVEGSRVIDCKDCKTKIVVSPGNEDLVRKNAKAICAECALKRNEKDKQKIPDEQRMFLERLVASFKKGYRKVY